MSAKHNIKGRTRKERRISGRKEKISRDNVTKGKKVKWSMESVSE